MCTTIRVFTHEPGSTPFLHALIKYHSVSNTCVFLTDLGFVKQHVQREVSNQQLLGCCYLAPDSFPLSDDHSTVISIFWFYRVVLLLAIIFSHLTEYMSYMGF